MQEGIKIFQKCKIIFFREKMLRHLISRSLNLLIRNRASSLVAFTHSASLKPLSRERKGDAFASVGVYERNTSCQMTIREFLQKYRKVGLAPGESMDDLDARHNAHYHPADFSTMPAPPSDKDTPLLKEPFWVGSDLVQISGRVGRVRWASRRLAFVDLWDGRERVQVMLQAPHLEFTPEDICRGDWMQFTGIAKRTSLKSDNDSTSGGGGELSLLAREMQVLAKCHLPTSSLPCPEKNALEDAHLRSSQRHLDLIGDPVQRMTPFLIRSEVLQEIRSFFQKRDFCEVSTPVLSGRLGGAAARPFATQRSCIDASNGSATSRSYYLRISPELYLKECLVAGLTRVFEIGPVFRDEDSDSQHSPEFTMLEW